MCIRGMIAGTVILSAAWHAFGQAEDLDLMVSKVESMVSSLESELDRILVQCPACQGSGKSEGQTALSKAEKAVLNRSLELGFEHAGKKGDCPRCRGYGHRLLRGFEEEALAVCCKDIQLRHANKEVLAKVQRNKEWDRRMTRLSLLAVPALESVHENCGNDLARRVAATESDPTGSWLTLIGRIEAVHETGRTAVVVFRESQLAEITDQPVGPKERLYRIRVALPDYEKDPWILGQKVGVDGVVIPEPPGNRWMLDKADVLVQSYLVVRYPVHNAVDKKRDGPSRRH